MTASIPAARLATALEAHHQGASILSLDCFDTLIWRTTHEPHDVFAAIGAGFGIGGRIRAERQARRAQGFGQDRNEVSLGEIYRVLHHGADDQRIDDAARHEFEVESAHCFAFPPAVELIRNARARGMRVIVVSDMYLGAAAIRKLIAHAAGDEISSMIEQVFCSSDHGLSKAEGLFRTVLASLNVGARELLHIGDNPLADQQAPESLGIRAIRVEQFPESLAQQIRQEVAIASVIDPTVRASRPALQVHRAPLALAWEGTESDAQRLGLGTLGPLLHGFSRWLVDEIEHLSAEGKRVRPLFILRDGYLPHQAFTRVAPQLAETSQCVELSRFIGFASSMRGRADILRYLAYISHAGRYDAIAQQLLFTARETAALVARVRNAPDREKAFCAAILEPENVALVAQRSRQFAQRMFRYLKQHAKVREGDTVMLVDVGYHGTVQDRIAPVLAAELGVEVVGRYLLMGDVSGAGSTKTGFIGPDRYDVRALDSIFSYVAMLEQLCTSADASAIGYDENGAVVRKASDMKSGQSAVRAAAQRACLDYVDAFQRAYPSEPRSLDTEALRQGACSALSRFLFLPSPGELAALDGFEHDVNMGVTDKIQFFDPDSARSGMIRRGLSYAQNKAGRFVPAELRAEGIAASLSYLTLKRFGMNLCQGDFAQRAIRIPVLLADGCEATQTEVQAVQTHDGWFMAPVPLGTGSYAVGMHVGVAFEWLQVHGVGVVTTEHFMSVGDLANERDISSLIVPENVEQHAGGLMRCAGEDSFLFFPPLGAAGADCVLTFVFRPIALREAKPAALTQPAAAAPAHAA